MPRAQDRISDGLDNFIRTGMNATCSVQKPFGLEIARAVHCPFATSLLDLSTGGLFFRRIHSHIDFIRTGVNATCSVQKHILGYGLQGCTQCIVRVMFLLVMDVINNGS